MSTLSLGCRVDALDQLVSLLDDVLGCLHRFAQRFLHLVRQAPGCLVPRLRSVYHAYIVSNGKTLSDRT